MFLAAALTFVSLSLPASDSFVTNEIGKELQHLNPFQPVPEGPEAGVIIELREPPLLERRQQARAAAATTIDSLIARLDADLRAIEGRERGGPRASAMPERMVRHAYRLTFAGASARVSRQSIPAIRALPYVKAVHFDRQLQAHLVESVPQVRAPEVWETYGVRGQGVVIAIIDTGIDYTHRALGRGFGPGFRVIGGYDFHNDDADPMDDHGHGTHVAGIAAANSETLRGVAPDASLLAYKVLDQYGGGELSNIIAGVERAVDPDANGDPSDRADIINMSLGGPRMLTDPLVDAVERAVAAGAVVVLSAGNARANGAIGSPAIAPSAITVAATDLRDRRAEFSSRGPAGGTWQAKPEIAAPGQDIVSARPGGGTFPASGTSMAAPHVAGVAALILQKHPDWTPEEVKAAIVSTGKPAYQYNEPAAESVLSGGGGRIDARAAIEATILPSPSTLSFGLVTRRNEPYTATRTIRLTNRGNDAETIAISSPALPKGATLTIEPASVTIAKGESADVRFTLDLRGVAPEASEDYVALTGWIHLTGPKRAQRLPWVAVNGNLLSATYDFLDTDKLYVYARARGYGERAYFWPQGPRTLAAFLPAGEAELVGYFERADGTRRLVIREAEPVNGYTEVTIAPEDAKYKVEFAGADERGVPFETLVANGEAVSTISQIFVISGWVYVALPDIKESTEAVGERVLWVSPLKNTALRTVEVLVRDDARYATMYPVIRSLDSDRKLVIEPHEWAWQTIEHECTTPKCEAALAAGAGSLAVFGLYSFPTGPGSWKLFMTGRVAEEWDFRSYLLIREEGWKPQEGVNPWNYLSAALRNVGGRISAAPFSRSYLSADYVSPSPYRPIVFGDGPAVLRTGLGTRRLEVERWGAALGETLGNDGHNLDYALYDASGNGVTIFPAGLSTRTYLLQRDPGAYRLELSLGYEIEGRPGKVSQTTHYDTRIGFGCPTLTMLRLEDGGGGVSNTVAQHSAARLLFAGRDTAWYENNYPIHRELETSATRAWWRPGGTAEWRPLAISQTGSDYYKKGEMPGPPGDLFAADIRPALAAPGPVDIKIRLMNGWDAVSDIVYEPAFIVTPAEGRRRSVR